VWPGGARRRWHDSLMIAGVGEPVELTASLEADGYLGRRAGRFLGRGCLGGLWRLGCGRRRCGFETSADGVNCRWTIHGREFLAVEH